MGVAICYSGLLPAIGLLRWVFGLGLVGLVVKML